MKNTLKLTPEEIKNTFALSTDELTELQTRLSNTDEKYRPTSLGYAVDTNAVLKSLENKNLIELVQDDEDFFHVCTSKYSIPELKQIVDVCNSDHINKLLSYGLY